MRTWPILSVATAAILYGAAPTAALLMLAPTWHHSPKKAPETDDAVVAPVRTNKIRMVDEKMRVASFVAPVIERNVVETDKENPDAPPVTRFIAGEVGYAVLDGPDQIEVRLPEDCDWEAAKKSVGSMITVQARYWVRPDGTPNRTVFMPAARNTICTWDGEPVKVEERSAKPEADDGADAGEGTPRKDRKPEQ